MHKSDKDDLQYVLALLRLLDWTTVVLCRPTNVATVFGLGLPIFLCECIPPVVPKINDMHAQCFSFRPVMAQQCLLIPGAAVSHLLTLWLMAKFLRRR